MPKIPMNDCCDDPECVFCQDDDGDAAFWDEFYFACEMAEENEPLVGERCVSVIDDDTGEVFELDEVSWDEPLTIISE